MEGCSKCKDFQLQFYNNKNEGILATQDDENNSNIAVVDGNDIHRNYCGGIRLCLNRFDNTLIRDNMIHDHTGPHLVQTSLASGSKMNTLVLSEDFRIENSKAAILMKNKTYNNDISYGDISKYDHLQ